MTNCTPTDEQAKKGWGMVLHQYQPQDEKRREAIFALGNGVLMTRAATAESVIGTLHYPGTYHAGCYEHLHSKVAGQWDQTESLANLPNWLPIRMRIDEGAWLSLDDMHLHSYSHGLDLQRGTAWRQWSLREDNGRVTHFVEQRLMSMAEPNLGALRLSVTSGNWSGKVELLSLIDGDVRNANVERYLDYTQRHVEIAAMQRLNETDVLLRAQTPHSKVTIDTAIRTVLSGAPMATRDVIEPRFAVGHRFMFELEQGQTVEVTKLAAICADRMTGEPASARSCASVLSEASDFEAVKTMHEQTWLQLWQAAAIDASEKRVALALRFQMFHLLQTVSPHSVGRDTGIPARGWHGEVYRGQVFWDELFVLPFYTFRFPEIAKSAVLYRHRRLNTARAAARAAGYNGAMFPWRSAATGEEVTPEHQKNLVSGNWVRDPTHLQHHIGSAVVCNAWRYYLATGDYEFIRREGAELIIEVARFWSSIATYDEDSGRYDIAGVIGPDEYHNMHPHAREPGLKNNAYTNLMAVWTLCRAIELIDILKPKDRLRLTEQLNLSAAETERWDHQSRRIKICFHGDRIISQFEGFELLREFKRGDLPERIRDTRADWALEAVGERVDEYDVTKQADTLTLFYLLTETEIRELFARLGYHYDCNLLKRTADYYLRRASHRSSLSQVVYAGALAYVDPDTSWHFFSKALQTDIEGLDGESTAEGIHLGAMGGVLDIVQRCYAGISPCASGLRVIPNMPKALGTLTLRLWYHRQRLRVTASADGVEMQSEAGNSCPSVLLTADGLCRLDPGQSLFVRNCRP